MMRISLRGCLLALSLAPLAPLPAAAQEPQAEEHPEVVTAGSAERSVPADLATLTLRFHRTDTTTALAGRRVALKADSIRRALEAVGIPRDSVVNASRWYWWRDRVQAESRQVGHVPVYEERNGRRQHVRDSLVMDTVYHVHETLTVRIRDLSRVGRVVDAALAQGITEISNIAFSATDTEEVQREMIREATRRARARAEVIAAAGGGRLGRTLRLSTEGTGNAVRYRSFLDLEGLGPAGSVGEVVGGGETVVVAPVIRVSATVYGRWELIENR